MNRKQEHHRRQFDLSHRFYKDFVGFFLFLFVYFAIFLQIMGVYLTWDYDFESHLIFHKFFFAIICILAIISHIRASFADPGKMNYLNNVEYCNFYLTTHSKSLERAKVLMTQSYTKALIQSLENESEDDEEEESEDDEFEYERKSYISEENRMEISQKFGIDFKRCDKCLVVRPPKVHHCSVCRGCVMRMDHHCPWINNCVGQFNQKFFILFCLYCFLGCLYACVLTPYYIIYLNKNEFLKNYILIGAIALQLVFGIIFLIFTAWMLYDQWIIIKDDTTMIDMKQKRILERRELIEILEETFGGKFGVGWFIPLKSGGFLNTYLTFWKEKSE